jgi:peptidyl-prolyl cis-trans isomerase D
MLDVIRQKSQSFGVKIIFGIIILVFVFWGASSVNTGSTQALAKVNDVEINAMDFNLEYRKQAETLRSIPGFSSLDSERREALGQYVLQQMISREIVRQEGVKLGLGTSDTELSYLVVKTPQFLDADGKFSQDIYKAVLASSGMTPGIYERSLSNEIMEYKLRDYIGASVSLSPEEAHQTFRFDFERRVVEYILFPSADYSARVKPEEKEIAEYYEANKETFAIPPMADFDYLIFNAESLSDSVTFTEAELQEYYEQNISSFEEPERYHVRHILIAVPASIADDDAITKEALEKAGKAKAELAAGKSFAAVALEYSDDSQSRQNGGDLDWLERVRRNKFLKMLFSL